MLSLAVAGLSFSGSSPSLHSGARPAVTRVAGVYAQSGSDLAGTPGWGSSFDKGMADFKADFPWLAMFGLFMILGTAVFQKYGLFPNPSTPLNYGDWGALTQMGFGQYITNERAIIMIAHIHALAVSAAAAFG